MKNKKYINLLFILLLTSTEFIFAQISQQQNSISTIDTVSAAPILLAPPKSDPLFLNDDAQKINQSSSGMSTGYSNWKCGWLPELKSGDVGASDVYSCNGGDGIQISESWITAGQAGWYIYLSNYGNVKNLKIKINSLLSDDDFPANNEVLIYNWATSSYNLLATLPNNNTSKTSWTSPSISNPGTYITAANRQVAILNNMPAADYTEFDNLRLEFDYNNDPISVTPNPIDLGTVCVGKTSTKQVTISNAGYESIGFTPQITGTNASEFSITNGMSYNLGGGNSINFTIAFNPTTKGTKSATFTLNLPAPFIDKQISISAKASGAPNSPTSVTATRNLYDKIRITWSDKSDDETGFYVYRGTGIIKTLPAGTQLYDDPEAFTCQDINYSISAFNSCSESSKPNSTGYRLAYSSLTVTILPQDAANDGLKWRLSTESSTNWHSSGYTLLNIPSGNHTVYYNESSCWSAPASENISLTCAENKQHSSPSSQKKQFSVCITLLPSEVASSAQWRIIGSNWKNSGECDQRSAGQYQIEFSNVTGYEKPQNQTITVSCNPFSNTYTYEKTTGTISGNISTSGNPPAPEGGVSVCLQPGGKCSTTDNNGNYMIADVPFGAYTVLPNYIDINNTIHTFLPANTPIVISKQNPDPKVNFVDVTAISISGVIKYSSTSCPVPNVSIKVDNVIKGTTNSNGEYSISTTAGKHIITPEKGDHLFIPAFEDKVFSINSVLNFVDSKKYSLTISVKGGCNIVIGSAEISISSKNSPCYSTTINTDPNGDWTGELPPLIYTINAKIPSKNIELTSIEVDLTNGNKTVPFVYHSPLYISVEGIPEKEGCNPKLFFMERGNEQQIKISIYEEYNGNKCPVANSTIKIRDGISDKTEQTFSVVNGTFDYIIKPGAPNVNHPFTKHFEIHAEQQGFTSGQDFAVDVVVLGAKFQGTTFTTTSPKLPLMILHTPNGDKSYSYVEKSYEREGYVGLSFETQIGGEISVGASADMGFANGEIAGVFGMNMTGRSDFEYRLSTKTTQRYQTSSNENPELIGPGRGDIVAGAALNITYGIEDVVEIENCAPKKTQRLSWGVSQFASNYLYSVSYIKNSIIPLLHSQGLTEDVNLWKNVLNLDIGFDNKITLDEMDKVKFVENKSFSAGTIDDHSKTISVTKRASFDFIVEVTQEVATKFGLKVLGNGVSGGVKVKASMKIGASAGISTTTSTTTAYHFEDNDDGDAFSVDIYEDLVWGNPIFITASGKSSCPAESQFSMNDSSWTISRQKVAISITPGFLEVKQDQVAKFTLKLSNESPTGDPWTYMIAPIQVSNDCGAIIKLNGQPVENGLPIGPILQNHTDSLVLTVEAGNALKNSECGKLLMRAFSNCDQQIADTADFSVKFIMNCGIPVITHPVNKFIVDPLIFPSIDVMVTYPSDAINSLKYLDLYYLRQGEQTWHHARKESVFSSMPYKMSWNINSLSYGAYTLKVQSTCTDGTSWSDTVNGSIINSPCGKITFITPLNLFKIDAVTDPAIKIILDYVPAVQNPLKNIELEYNSIGMSPWITIIKDSSVMSFPKEYNWNISSIPSGNYRLLAIATCQSGNSSSDTIGGLVTSVKKIDNEKPTVFSLSQNYPNPFNPSTIIRYSIPRESFVQLAVFDALGRLSSFLVNQTLSRGNYEVIFDGSMLTNGVYFYQIKAGNYIATKKLVLIK